MGKEKKKKSSKERFAVQQRRDGDLQLSHYAKKALEKYLGGKEKLLELAREQLAADVTELETSGKKMESVRLILDQSKTGKMIVIRRAADLNELCKMALPKIGMKKANAVYVVDRKRKHKIDHTMDLADDSRVSFVWEKPVAGETSTPYILQKEAIPVNNGTEVDAQQKPSNLRNTESSSSTKQEEQQATVNAKKNARKGVEENEDDSLEDFSASNEEEDQDDDEDEEEDDDEEDEDDANDDLKEGEDETETVPTSLLDRARQTFLGDREQAERGTASQKELGPVDINFAKVNANRSKLPIDLKQKELVELVARHQVTIVRAPTGSGKSTRLVQFVLESHPSAKMIVTEPRRIAAISLADRVSSELGEKHVGRVVGYSVRTESKQSAMTRILYCTVGVLLRRISFDGDLVGVTHVVVDEAHERDVLTDTLLIFLRRLALRRPEMKVIVLSATMVASKFKDYFTERGIPCADIEVDGFVHPVESLYLEQLEQKVGRKMNGGGAGIAQQNQSASTTLSSNKKNRDRPSPANSRDFGGKNASPLSSPMSKKEGLVPRQLSGQSTPSNASHNQHQRPVRRVLQLPQLDVEFISALVKFYIQKHSYGVGKGKSRPGQQQQQQANIPQQEPRRSILIFVSGQRDITRIISKLNQDLPMQLETLPLHSQLSSEDQRRVFLPPRDPRRTKVVVATNVAETSITIDDCGLVIDSCRVKESRYDADTRAWHLEESLVSRSALMQRRGRAGRTAPGEAYHLISELEVLDEQPTPGMCKDSLEDAVLMLKATKQGQDAYAFFGEAIDPPSVVNILRILEDLSDLGAIRGSFSTGSDATELTPLGFALTRLGTDCRKGKLLILGLLMDCLDPVLSIAAALDGKSPFVFFGQDARKGLDKARRWFGDNDFVALVRVREAFLSNRLTEEMKDFVSLTALRLNEKLREEFINDMVQAGFISSREDVANHSKNGSDWRVIRICLAGGLFPHVGRIDQELALMTGPHQLVPSKFDYSGTIYRATKEEAGKFFVYHERARVSTEPNAPMNVRKAIDVTPMALALLGGGFARIRSESSRSKGGRFVNVRLGQCWSLKARPKDAMLIQHLRRRLDEAFLGMFERRSAHAEDKELLEMLRIVASSSKAD